MAMFLRYGILGRMHKNKQKPQSTKIEPET